MKNIELKIKGMHCIGCSNRLEKILSNLDGIQKAKVSLEENIAQIEYDETVSIQQIIEVIIDSGFEVEGE